MKKILVKIFKSFFIGSIAVVLVAVGIDAVDNYDNLSESILGNLISDKESGPCPEGMVFVSTDANGFCIDIFEASPGKNCPQNDISNQNDTRVNLDYSSCHPASEPGVLPWRFISQSQAMLACAKAGKRLPTHEEWYLASLGTPDREKGWGKVDCQVDSNWQSQPGLTGSGEKCQSSFGVYDMVGNVWEWTKGEAVEGLFDGKGFPKSGFIASVDSEGLTTETVTSEADPNFNEDYFWIKESGVRGLAKGGYWDNKSDAGIYAMYLVSPPSYAGAGIGFRCVK